MHELYDRFGGQVAFFVVYIKEAHPEDGWVVIPNREEGIAINEPASEEERAETAGACALRVHIRIPVLLDAMDNRVASMYGGWPDRLYLVGRDGRIAFQGGEGPWGFQPEELAHAIAQALAVA